MIKPYIKQLYYFKRALVSWNGSRLYQMVKGISFTYVPTFQHGRKILDFRLFESLKNVLSRILYSPKASLERWFLHFLHKNFSKFPPDIAIEVSIIACLLPQHFSWFKNYKSSWFSNLLLVLFSLMSKQ